MKLLNICVSIATFEYVNTLVLDVQYEAIL